jgi:hypothetical protein
MVYCVRVEYLGLWELITIVTDCIISLLYYFCAIHESFDLP